MHIALDYKLKSKTIFESKEVTPVFFEKGEYSFILLIDIFQKLQKLNFAILNLYGVEPSNVLNDFFLSFYFLY